MKNKKRILDLMKNNNGTITTRQITNEGISRSSLKHLLDCGLIEKVGRGVYTLPEVWEDEFFILQQRYRKGIYSLATSLFLNGLTERTPNKYHMTFPINYNVTNIDKQKIVSNRVTMEVYELGMELIRTPGGNLVYCYSTERTLCDILKTKNKVDIQLVSEAFKNYFQSEQINIRLLSEYSKVIGVEQHMRRYLEVLL